MPTTYTDGIDDKKPALSLVQREKRRKAIQFDQALPNPDGTYGTIYISDFSRPESTVTLQGVFYTAALVAAEFAKLQTRVTQPPSGTIDPTMLEEYGIWTYTTADGATYQGALLEVNPTRVDHLDRYTIELTLRRTDI